MSRIRVSEKCEVRKVDGRFNECDSEMLIVDIMYGGERIGLCREHWDRIALSDREWGEE